MTATARLMSDVRQSGEDGSRVHCGEAIVKKVRRRWSWLLSIRASGDPRMTCLSCASLTPQLNHALFTFHNDVPGNLCPWINWSKRTCTLAGSQTIDDGQGYADAPRIGCRLRLVRLMSSLVQSGAVWCSLVQCRAVQSGIIDFETSSWDHNAHAHIHSMLPPDITLANEWGAVTRSVHKRCYLRDYLR